MLDVVELGALAPVVGGRERLELLQRLTAEVRAVDEEEDAAGACVLDRAIGDARRRIRLASAGRHLDQGAGPVLRERALEVADRGRLGRPEPLRVELGEVRESVPQRRRERVLLHMADPGGKRFRPVEPEDLPTPRLEIERVGEAGLDAGRLVGERQRSFERAHDPVGQAVEVLRRLPLDASECGALGLRLDHADRLAVDEEEIVRATVWGLEDELADGDAARGGEVHVACVLDSPAGCLEHLVDLDAGLVLGGKVRLHGHKPRLVSGRFASSPLAQFATLYERSSSEVHPEPERWVGKGAAHYAASRRRAWTVTDTGE